jgi:hypothetical protein
LFSKITAESLPVRSKGDRKQEQAKNRQDRESAQAKVRGTLENRSTLVAQGGSPDDSRAG